MKKEIRKEEDSSYPYSLYIDGYFVNSYRKKKDIPTMRDMRINIMGERKAQNVAKELGIELRIIHGDWNGYGCPIIGRTVSGREYSKIMKIVDAKPSRPALTEEEKTEKWAKRLSKLTGISEKEAMQIAQEKIDYKIEQINMMEYRQSDERYSKKRQSLINQMERANPLRRIEDEDHAQRILNASERHNNTNYENELDNARELAELGEINRGEVREHARMAIV